MPARQYCHQQLIGHVVQTYDDLCHRILSAAAKISNAFGKLTKLIV
jgi:hypothetical protein